MNPYMNFVAQERPKIATDHPDFTFGEIGRELGRRWRALTDEEKEKFSS